MSVLATDIVFNYKMNGRNNKRTTSVLQLKWLETCGNVLEAFSLSLTLILIYCHYSFDINNRLN
jgi:hypothetical protein